MNEMKGKLVIGIIIALVFLVIIFGFKSGEEDRSRPSSLVTSQAARLLVCNAKQKNVLAGARQKLGVEQPFLGSRRRWQTVSISERYYSGTGLFEERIIAELRKVVYKRLPKRIFKLPSWT